MRWAKKRVFALKFDMKKAYDFVEWGFLKDVLLAYSFDTSGWS